MPIMGPLCINATPMQMAPGKRTSGPSVLIIVMGPDQPNLLKVTDHESGHSFLMDMGMEVDLPLVLSAPFDGLCF